MGGAEEYAVAPLGLRGGIVTVVRFDERWPGLFGEAYRELREALGSKILTVHHVGITSVPGLCAKPVLDILVFQQFEHGLDLVPILSMLGYAFRADEEIPDRHYFRRGNDQHWQPVPHGSRAMITIRRARPSDAESLAALNHDFNGVLRHPDQVRQSLLVDRSPETVVVAEEAGAVVGFLTGECP